MVLLGRAKQLPLAILPPFRFEILAQLATNNADALYQSYERQRIFAGKISKGLFQGWDWAPILLSPQLEDTEFGILLNLADQVLKSQPKPITSKASTSLLNVPHVRGPEAASSFFARTLATSGPIYNWNTHGFASVAELPRYRVMTVSDSAALPAVFIPVQGGVAARLVRAPTITLLRTGWSTKLYPNREE